MRFGLILLTLSFGLGPVAASAQSAVQLEQASSTCLVEAPGGENLQVTVAEQKDGPAALRIRTLNGASDKTVRLFRMCLRNKLGPNYMLAAADVAETTATTNKAGKKKFRLFQRRNLNRNPLCPDFAGVIYAGNIYCIGNQS